MMGLWPITRELHLDSKQRQLCSLALGTTLEPERD